MKKNSIFTVLILFFFFNFNVGFGKSISLEIVDCVKFASEATAVMEEYFGCMDTETYNQTYSNFKNLCNGG